MDRDMRPLSEEGYLCTLHEGFFLIYTENGLGTGFTTACRRAEKGDSQP